MPPTTTETSGSAPSEGATGFQLPWAAIPKFIPGTTDVTEYSRKLEFLAAMWPREHLSLLAPRAALQVEGTAFKKISSLNPEKLKSNDESGIKLLVSTLGGSWGKTDLEAKYDVFEKALYGTVQKPDETNDSYLARHDVHFEELLSQGVTFEQVRAYILLRQSQLSMEDRKKIIVEMGGSLEYKKVCSSIRLLGSRFFADLQGQKTAKTRTYDANLVEDAPPEESERAYGAFSASAADEGETELDDNFLETMVASEDQDALQVQAFEEELENFFQDTPELQEALVSYIEARSRLLAKKKSRGFWPIGAGKGSTKGGRGFKGSGKGKGKHREQLLARIARSTCRICGKKGHWKAECPRRKQSSSGEATTTVAEAFAEALEVPGHDDEVPVPEISTQLPADALSLEEALVVCWIPNPNEINLKLQKLVQKLKTPKPRSTKISFHRPRNSGEPRLTDESCCFLKRSCDSEPAIAALVHHQGPVEAILDTGASRCVMGKSLLQRFLGQLNDSVRSRVRITKSSIRFRFGNNQTLLSERRIHLPFGTPNQQVLWLGIEIVPGSTPLLFSKRAIKQLGGLIDTEADVCELRRLQKSLSMQTGPTGLYMIDLARLCEESNAEVPCQHVCEEQSQVAAFADPCMIGKPSAPGTKTFGCIDSHCPVWGSRAKNSDSALKPIRASAINENVSALKGALQAEMPVTAHHEHQRTVPGAAAPAISCAPRYPPPCFRSLPNHGPEQQRFRSSSLRGLRQQPGHASCPPPRPGAKSDSGAAAGPFTRGPWSSHRELRHQGERPYFSRCRRERSRVDQVDRRAHEYQPQTKPPELHQVRRKVREPSRGDRSGLDRNRNLGRAADSHDCSSQTQGALEQQGRAQGEQSPCDRGRERGPLGVHGGAGDHRSGDRPEPPHADDGTDDAGDDFSHSATECRPECLVSEVTSCQRELEALLASSFSTSAAAQNLENQAKQILLAKSGVQVVKNFLKQVPWHELSESSSRDRVITKATEAQKPPAYVSFGMYVHGGVVGITKVARNFPWLTRLITYLVRLSDPDHRFTSVGISCNACAEPHRDSYNSERHDNLVIPLEYPETGGEIWVVKAPHARQQSQERLCGSKGLSGALVALKPALHLDPHCWHATAPWTGNRI